MTLNDLLDKNTIEIPDFNYGNVFNYFIFLNGTFLSCLNSLELKNYKYVNCELAKFEQIDDNSFNVYLVVPVEES